MSPFIYVMEKDMKERIKSVLRKIIPVLVIGIAYFVWIKLTHITIPCVFHLITGKYCPGCGITRMVMALAKFDFASAAHYNLFVLCLLPFGIVLYSYKLIRYIKSGETKSGIWEKSFYIIAFLLCIVFCIVRNSHWGAFLAP